MTTKATTAIATEETLGFSHPSTALAALVADTNRAVLAWASPNSGGAHRFAAEQALLGTEFANNSATVRLLAAALVEASAGLVRELLAESAGFGDISLAVVGGMLAFDAKLAEWTEVHDQIRGQMIRQAAMNRLEAYRHDPAPDAAGLFKLWVNDGAAALANVARTLWLSRVRAEWERKQRVRPAIIRAVAGDLLSAAMTRPALSLADGRVRGADGRPVGRVDIATVDAAAIERVRSGLELLSSVAAHRLLRVLVHTVHDQWESGDRDPRAVEFEGGWQALAQVLRDNGGDNDRLRAILDAGQIVSWSHSALTIGGLWTWTEKRGGPGCPGYVRIIVGDSLAPGLAARLATNGNTAFAATRARQLVPELRAEPPVAAVRSNEQGAAWMLHRLVIVELVDGAIDLVQRGSVGIKPERWLELANQVRLPRSALPSLMSSWLSGESELAPALLVETERGRFTLADPHQVELDFIVDGGQARIDGRRNARKGKENKARC